MCGAEQSRVDRWKKLLDRWVDFNLSSFEICSLCCASITKSCHLFYSLSIVRLPMSYLLLSSFYCYEKNQLSVFQERCHPCRNNGGCQPHSSCELNTWGAYPTTPSQITRCAGCTRRVGGRLLQRNGLSWCWGYVSLIYKKPIHSIHLFVEYLWDPDDTVLRTDSIHPNHTSDGLETPRVSYRMLELASPHQRSCRL